MFRIKKKKKKNSELKEAKQGAILETFNHLQDYKNSSMISHNWERINTLLPSHKHEGDLVKFHSTRCIRIIYTTFDRSCFVSFHNCSTRFS